MIAGRGSGKTTKTITSCLEAAANGKRVVFISQSHAFIDSVARPIMEKLADRFSTDAVNRVRFISASDASRLIGCRNESLYFDHSMMWEQVCEVARKLPMFPIVFE
jgi:hypothetical protein